MQIKDLELSRELTAEEQAAVEGGTRGGLIDLALQRDSVKQANVESFQGNEQSQTFGMNFMTGANLSGAKNVYTPVNVSLNQDASNDNDTDIDQIR
jgi:hypothetical protein